MSSSGQGAEDAPELTSVVERNIELMLERRRREEEERTWSERVADRITRFAGSLSFIYLHLCVFGAWILSNSGLLPLPRFDPSFVLLAVVASVEGILLTTLVLITQNRMSLIAERRAELDLQISLLAEHEVTQLIHMVSALTRHAGIETHEAEEIAELQKDVAPEKVLDRIEGRPQAGRPQDGRPPEQAR